MEFLGAGFVDAFLSVLAIIGIILIGGFLIFFLGDLVLSVLDPNYVRFGHKKKSKEESQELVKQLENKNEELKELEFKLEEADENAFVKDETPVGVIEQGIDDNFFKDEKVEPIEEEPEVQPVIEEEPENEEVDELKAEEELFKQNMMKEIEERRQKQQAADDEATFKNFFFGAEDIDVFSDEEPLDGQEEIQIEAPVEETPEEYIEEISEIVEEPEAETENEETVEDEKVDAAIEELKAQFQAEIAKLQEKNQLLEKELETKEVVSGPTMGIEEYESRLETLRERLSANEKELRKVKKEYIPLRKVNKTLESDERKLRRKEAIVAKQKVVLYGVNNIADIDEEKAKKLSEELDLLEGLKLSVQHCEEVMASNKDRYPILENTYNILTNNNETLKADIAQTEAAIEKLKLGEEN